MATMSQLIVFSFKVEQAGRRAKFVVYCFCLPSEFFITEVDFGEVVEYFFLHLASFDFQDALAGPFDGFLLI